MKRAVFLSFATLITLQAQDVVLDPVSVDATTLSDVATNAKVSADLGEVLAKDIPSIDMSRRSGIANDIIIRGQKRDNISVSVDGTKTYGACPNRMDPPISHVLSNNVENVEVIEGPYDVTEYGNVGGGVKITTKAPRKGAHGDVSFGAGSWNYKKIAATFDGGNDYVRLLFSGSTEDSDQYEDGDGNTLSQQLDNALGNPTADKAYIKKDLQAYSKQSFMTKLYINPTQNQEIRLGYTANRSDDVLYPNSGMDAYYDDSDIYNVEYEFKNIASWYKNVTLQYSSSDVDHPMGTKYRYPENIDMINHMWSSYDAFKLKNRFNFNQFLVDFGLETGKRNWDGEYTKNGQYLGKSLADVDTTNYSAYIKIDKKFGALDLSVGTRYDNSEIRPDSVKLKDRDFDSFGANIFANYNIDKINKLFFGFGQAQRVPDARELYFQKSGKVIGNQDLEQVTNQEFDLGYKLTSNDADFKIKGFYSMLRDYIYVNANKLAVGNAMENIDATIYGVELSGNYYITDAVSLEGWASYKVGEKDKPLEGQTDTDLADIAPLTGRVGVVYDYMPNSYVRLDVEARDTWRNYDADNGEQEIDSWSVVDFKAKHSFNKHIALTVGVNNIFNTTYVRSNTYKDLTLVIANTKDVMLLNEPGRYIYTNFDFRF
jgi:iron complex outermembrane receptor protein